MELQSLLQELHAKGAIVEVRDGRVRVRPQTAVTPVILAALREHKAELIDQYAAGGNGYTFPEKLPELEESVTARKGIEVPIGPVPSWLDLEAVFRWLDEPPRRECPWCPLYRHGKAWRSVFGPHLICATCHPPAMPDVVAEWIGEAGACR